MWKSSGSRFQLSGGDRNSFWWRRLCEQQVFRNLAPVVVCGCQRLSNFSQNSTTSHKRSTATSARLHKLTHWQLGCSMPRRFVNEPLICSAVSPDHTFRFQDTLPRGDGTQVELYRTGSFNSVTPIDPSCRQRRDSPSARMGASTTRTRCFALSKIRALVARKQPSPQTSDAVT